MKHIFIVNPAAGKASTLPSLLQRITYAVKLCGVDYEIYHTKTVGDATNYVHTLCTKNPKTQYRFYACGGDGTMNEVANAVAMKKNAELAVVPVGTGNDFIKIFSHLEQFDDISSIIKGKALPMDIIKYNDKYSLNILNIGFDCDVVARVEEIKRQPLVLKNMAYPTAVWQCLTRKYGSKFRVTTEDGQFFDGEHLLALFANARYYGGGYKSAPYAFVNDGMMEIVVVDKVSRAKFISLLPKYQAGTYLEEIEKLPFIHYVRCKKATFESEKAIGVCADGEISPAAKLDIEVIPNAINVVCPQGCKCKAYVKQFDSEKKESTEGKQND